MNSLTKPLHRPVGDALVDAAGVDGCRNGWVVATERAVTFEPRLHRGLGTTVGVDMPIGLPETAPRVSDRQLRAFLGPRRASVFTTPPRACLDAGDHAAAVVAARAAIGTGLSIQAFNLLPEIRELDALVVAGETQFVEVHPEASFLVMNAMEPLPAKTTSSGAARRAELLRSWYGALPAVPRPAEPDDLYDALAVLWSVHRYERGAHLTFGDATTDRRGRPMRVIC